MGSYQIRDLAVTPDKEGSWEFLKVSYPARYGRFGEIKTPDYTFQFNLNGEIKFIEGRSGNWPHPQEWLKRTIANDWVYYSAGDYSGLYDLLGEYYLPCLSYPSNSFLGGNLLEDNAVRSAIENWQKLRGEIRGLIRGALPDGLKDFLIGVTDWNEESLRLRSDEFHHLIGGPVTVLPPDSRHVDYEVIPVIVADGCLYNCGFCRVKSGQEFEPRSPKDIIDQIKDLKRFYGRDLHNYNALFLGHHDALRAGRELLELAAKTAYETFEFDHSYVKGAFLFLFGSVDSLLHAEEVLFEFLNSLPFFTYLNIGLESANRATLALLRKPVSVEMIREAFARMVDINRKYERVEVTANFVFGEGLPADHLLALMDLAGKKPDLPCGKGCLYLSPLVGGEVEDVRKRRELLRQFNKVKTRSRLPVYLYLIQRL
jgi:hypothetical protein